MDNLTHSLFALTLARTRLRPGGPAGGATTAVLLLSSNAPDVDIVAVFSGGPGSYLAAHRGSTHGPLGVVSLAIVCAALVTIVGSWRSGQSSNYTGFGRLTMVALLGAVLHIAMDLPTPYGTRLLSPFSTRWYAFDWLPIIDVYLWILLAGGLTIGRLWPARRRTAAVIALVLTVVNYGVRAAGHAAAVARGGGSSPWRLETWNGEPPRPCAATWDVPCESLAAIPSFGGPFFWTLVRPTSDGYQLLDIDVKGREWWTPRWVLNERNRWTASARESRLGRIFYAFARFPAARVVRASDEGVTVRIHDVRYPGPSIGEETRRSPFVATIDMDPAGRVRRESVGR